MQRPKNSQTVLKKTKLKDSHHTEIASAKFSFYKILQNKEVNTQTHRD